MRKHQITPDVGQRDSAYFSVIDDEWPDRPRRPRSPPRLSRRRAESWTQRQVFGPSTASSASCVVARLVVGVDDAFGRGAHFFAGFAGRRHRLFGDVGDALARLAADDVAEGFLEAVGAPPRVEALFGLRLLLRPPLAVAVPRPGRVGLADPARPVDRQRGEEDADRSRAAAAP